MMFSHATEIYGKKKSEKRNAIRQGTISNDGCTESCIKLRINAGNKDATNAQDKALVDAYRNKFIIPLDFEMLDSAAPYYQAGLRNRPNPEYHHQKFQRQSIRSQTYP